MGQLTKGVNRVSPFSVRYWLFQKIKIRLDKNQPCQVWERGSDLGETPDQALPPIVAT